MELNYIPFSLVVIAIRCSALLVYSDIQKQVFLAVLVSSVMHRAQFLLRQYFLENLLLFFYVHVVSQINSQLAVYKRNLVKVRCRRNIDSRVIGVLAFKSVPKVP